ncbi:conserved hypothetical protein [Leishmania mexicana MHOM/GT/2001/U1103]|uniref:Uncharacterized protein n=1 Tax=Leishmania mexicana (strain MHOM/GT/2001/U1103) TaxID=929439 RepID=E9B0F4_LEIMU|nr:conserved hypothetical protein [Leishmania mexicana MHOM/GT/2001/U1103]CBZ28708.1 conserved hypothetical protein [Leishmania mexicana MHOM/GT/2001/U1103]
MALSGLLCRASCYVAPSLSGTRLYRGVLSRASSTALALPNSASLTSSSVTPLSYAGSLREGRRGYAQQRNPHDSNTEDISNAFFDVQDVDADRLTHFYWDSNDDADTPYDTVSLDRPFGEGEADEWAGESLAFVDERDQLLLGEEYLK